MSTGLGVVALLVPIGPAAGQEPAGPRSPLAAALARIAVVEDARGTHGLDVDALVPFLAHRAPEVRAAAVRALGRQQDPRWLPRLYGAFRDPSVAVRMEAINGVGQALQRFRGSGSTRTPLEVQVALDSLARAAAAPGVTPVEAGLAARTLGRLPWGDSATARQAEAAIVRVARGSGRGGAPVLARLEGSFHGLQALARQRRSLGALSDEAIDLMRQGLRTSSALEPESAARVRRLAMLGLLPAGAVDPEVVQVALRDRDEQVRRLALSSEPARRDTAGRLAVVTTGLADPSPLVRFEAVRAARAYASTVGCGTMLTATGDDDPSVVLAAIDGLSAACVDRDRVATRLLDLIDANRSDSPMRAPARSGWHIHAHALLALARTNPDRARALVRREAREATLWSLRTWVARAATQVGDTATLATLARDRDPNVRATALGGLAAVAGSWGDSLYLEALGARGYQVTMQAAQALKGSPSAAVAGPALAATLERLTAERRENSRDARAAVLDRLEELGTPALAARLEALRTDFDSTIARRAAAIASAWSGRPVTAAPALLPLPKEDIGALMSGRWMARFRMSPATGGGTFEVELFPREAPFTVARFVRLARSGYYNGLTFHRVEPAFVIQGGSPAANEYVGDGPFMRDELSARSHIRGTLGISTRGRDTGDAQLFVNLTDNFRLDHDYTVFGLIRRGREVAEGILEADVIERVEIVRR